MIYKFIDFSFLLEKVRPYYSEDNGRPTDPLILFKMMFIGYIYAIRSERRLEREVRTNVAYRRFLGLKFKDSVPPRGKRVTGAEINRIIIKENN